MVAPEGAAAAAAAGVAVKLGIWGRGDNFYKHNIYFHLLVGSVYDFCDVYGVCGVYGAFFYDAHPAVFWCAVFHL